MLCIGVAASFTTSWALNSHEHQPQREAVMPALQRLVFIAALAAGGLAAPAVSYADQTFPTKPLRIVVPFTPGGTSDVLARLIGIKLSESWGQPVVIENRTGAGGTIGAGIVAKATPDGHTLLISSAAFTISAALHADNLPYDPIKDFAGVTRLGFSTTALIVHPSLGVRSVKELVEMGKAKPGHLITAHAGAGSSTHMNAERFRLAAGIKIKQVGFKGAADAMLEVISGRVHYGLLGLASSMPYIQDGKLIAVAVGTPERSKLLPDVPTIAETLPGFARDGSHSMLAPAGTPRPVLVKISGEVKRIFEMPDIKQRVQAFDFHPAPSTPEEHDRILRADIETFAGVVRVAGLRGR
jgi:tripartite-type tricarboxylate transporter receptor subunit TctC